MADLRVEQLQALPLAGDGAPDLLAVPGEQFEAFGLAGARLEGMLTGMLTSLGFQDVTVTFGQPPAS